jgi:hypothetical protein
MLLKNGVLDKGFFIIGQDVGIDHVVQSQFAYVVQGGGRHVEANGAVEQHASQLKQGMQGQGSHVGLGPPITAFFHVLFEFDPSGMRFMSRKSRGLFFSQHHTLGVLINI